jgi:hypothetical protein
VYKRQGLACGANGVLTSYTYQNATYTSATGCGDGGSNSPWLTLRGYLFTVP